MLYQGNRKKKRKGRKKEKYSNVKGITKLRASSREEPKGKTKGKNKKNYLSSLIFIAPKRKLYY